MSSQIQLVQRPLVNELPNKKLGGIRGFFCILILILKSCRQGKAGIDGPANRDIIVAVCVWEIVLIQQVLDI